MFLPHWILRRSGNKKVSPPKHPRVAALEWLEDRLTPVVDVGDSLATAQFNALLPLVGGIRYEGQIGDGSFGASDVDLIRFDVLQGATLRIETAPLASNPNMDTFLRLFNASGVTVASDDDSGVDAFSLITTAPLSAGTYYVGVSGFPNKTYDPAVANSGPAATSTGFYKLNITDTSFGFTLNGIDPGDRSGSSVNSAGDVNGDGFDDLIIGAYLANSAAVVFGKGSGFGTSLNLSSIDGTNGFIINGIDTGDGAGRSVSSAGDFNGDGLDDLLIGAQLADPNGVNAAGEVYVVFGKRSGFNASLDLSSLNGPNGFVINGIDANDRLGLSVSSAGDINGDGFDDLIFGTPIRDSNGQQDAGESYVVFGKGSGFEASLNLSTLDGINGFVIKGKSANDRAGWSVSSAGDINGDGFDDILIGAPGADPNGLNYAGESYVLFGKADGFVTSLDLATLDGANGFVISGGMEGMGSGFSVSSAGDINGDGFDDLLVKARFGAVDGALGAKNYVVFGKQGGFAANLNLSSLDGTNGFAINGIAAGDHFTTLLSISSVSSAGDVNGDGFDDILIGAPNADPNGLKAAGESYVIFGKGSGFAASLNLSTLDGTNGFLIRGNDVSVLPPSFGFGLAGFSVGSARDINGDGFDDLIVGAYAADSNGLMDAGESYVIFGRNFTNAVIQQGTDLGELITSTPGTNTIVAGQGNDTIISGGGADVVYAGQGDDYVEIADLAFRRIDGGSGHNRLTLTGSNQTLNLTTLPDNSLINFSEIFISGTGNNTLVVSPLDLLNLQAQSDTLIVSGNAGDIVRLEGGTWSRQADETVFGVPSFVFRAGKGVIKIPQSVTLQTPPIRTFASLNGSNGFVINGINADDLSGLAVSSAGDINGDGFDDLIIDAPGADPNGSYSGASYVVFGKESGFTASLDLSTLDGTNGFVINGIDPGDRIGLSAFSGMSVSSAGDVNGDGLDDLLIGAGFADPNGVDRAGECYVVYGKRSGFAASLNLSTLDGTNGFVMNGSISPGVAGDSVSSAGDINGDGFDDLIIGAPIVRATSNGSSAIVGASYVVFGKGSGFATSLDLSTLDGTNGFVISGIEGNASGWSVSSAGDINGDSFDDLIIGGWGNPTLRRSHVVFGKGSGFAATLNLATLDGTNGFSIYSNYVANLFGEPRVSSAGDVNGDGFDDLIIGVPFVYTNGLRDAGASYVVFGRGGGFTASLNLSTLDGTNGFVLNGIDVNDYSGWSVSSAGDINGDGFDDLVIGGYGPVFNGSRSGESYVVFGKGGGFSGSLDLSTLNGSNGLVISGIDERDGSGFSVSSAGDINGDGFDDLIIGAPGADPNGSYSGESYVVFGGNFTNATIEQGTAADELITGTASANAIVAGQGNDTIISGGGADVIYAGQGDDVVEIADLPFQRIDGGTGVDTLRLGNVNLNLSLLADNRLTNIEVIDLATTAGGQTLTVTPLEVLNISSSTNELTVDKAEEDNVVLGVGWSVEGIESRNSKSYMVYRSGEARLLVQSSTDLFGGGLSTNLSNPNLVDFMWLGTAGENNVSFSFDGTTNILTQTVTKFNSVDIGVTLRFMGVTGNIVLQGAAGRDTIDASGLGNMSLLGRNAPTLLSGGGSDSLIGSAGPDFISADGAEGADTIDGGAGNDTIFSGGGADSVRGGLGNDNIVDGGEGKDTIDGGDGNDTIQAGDGADRVIGGIGNDILIGDAKDSGRKDKDTLDGGSGRDILMGGLGADSLDGGADEDLIIAGNHTSADLALSFISLEWNSARTFAQRTANIAGVGAGPRANLNYFLQVGTTVVNDNVTGETPETIVDIVLGGSAVGEADWILADDPSDTRSDFQVGVDLLTDLSP